MTTIETQALIGTRNLLSVQLDGPDNFEHVHKYLRIMQSLAEKPFESHQGQHDARDRVYPHPQAELGERENLHCGTHAPRIRGTVH